MTILSIQNNQDGVEPEASSSAAGAASHPAHDQLLSPKHADGLAAPFGRAANGSFLQELLQHFTQVLLVILSSLNYH